MIYKTLLMSMRATEASNYKETRNSIAYEYIEFFEKLGYLIITIPNNTKYVKKYFDLKVDLLVLSGGNNINPNLYKNNSALDGVYNERDNMEKNLISLAIDNEIPVLGICRGFHILNIYFKGKLSHNIKNHVNKNHILKSNSDILNDKEANSFHNQAIYVDDLSKELELLATTEDSIVEACINYEKKILGLQWHPERQDKKYDLELINKFLEEKK